jgi:hypothetical protein
MSHPRILLALAVLIAIASGPRIAEACFGIGPTGPILVRGEEALIVWDEANHTEHFIRSARFENVSSDFGFIVPTPSEPTLTEVDEGVFGRLFALYRRPVPRTTDRGRSAGIGGLGSSGGAPDSVEVVSESRVAGLTGTVLRATGTTALDAWLTEHGYASTPELSAWLGPYVTRGYYLTAFRVDPEGASGSVAMRAVRMTFRTDVPFYPYSEPQIEGRRPRPFRVSVVGPQRVTARVGSTPWSASVGYARRTTRLRSVIGGVVPEGALTGTPWITVFDERRSMRGTDDLFFDPSEATRSVGSRIDRRIIHFRAR